MPAGPLGSKTFARNLVDALAEKDVKVHEATRPAANAAADALVTHFMERFERDLAPVVRDLWQHALDNDQLPDGLRNTIERGTNPEHQVDFFVNFVLTMAAIAASASALGQPFIQPALNLAWENHQYQPISPDAAAVAVLKGVWDYSKGANEAAQTGMDEERFRALVDASGDPPAASELLEMLRRGKISPARFVEGIRQGRFRLDWAADLEKMMHAPPSASMVMAGAVASQIDLGEARALWAENGMTPDSFDWVYNTTGPPPPTEELIQLWRRGDITEAEVHQALLEGPLKIKWIPTVMKMKRRVPPMEQTIAMVRRGVLSPAEGTKALLNLGYDAPIVAAFIAYASRETSAHERNLTSGLIRTAYTDGAITRGEAQTHLTTLGYTAGDATFILSVADAAEEHALHQSAVTRVRSLYRAHKLERTQASTDLDRLEVTPARRDAMLKVWDIERSTVTKELTLAQCQGALKRKLMTETEFSNRVLAMGYDTDDADLLTSLSTGQLTVAQTSKAFKRGDITMPEFRQRMRRRGLVEADIDLLVVQIRETDDTEAAP